MPLRLDVRTETWPLAATFTISRGAKTEAVVVTASVSDGNTTGRGECVPYPRYRESPASVTAELEAQAAWLHAGTRAELQSRMPAGAARNALDCALLDYEAKRSGVRATALLGLPEPRPLVTAYTLSLGTPEAMAQAAAAAAQRPLLKVKLGGDGDVARIQAVCEAAPGARLIVDANEAWSPENFAENMQACAQCGVELIEQPFPAHADDALRDLARPVPVCADESAHDRASLSGLADKYDAINIKLDKTGGLTEAVVLMREARAAGLSVMVGCMVGTSLSMAPAFLLAQGADFVDLDGPLLLARDRPEGLHYDGSLVHPPAPALWG